MYAVCAIWVNTNAHQMRGEKSGLRDAVYGGLALDVQRLVARM